jgi:hypothetical protein
MKSEHEALLRTAVPEYRDFLGKLRRRKRLSYRDIARKMGTPDDLLEQRERQLEHFFSDGENPRAGFALAVIRAIDPDLALTPEDFGWDPTKL